jgi:hypothetical protein
MITNLNELNNSPTVELTISDMPQYIQDYIAEIIKMSDSFSKTCHVWHAIEEVEDFLWTKSHSKDEQKRLNNIFNPDKYKQLVSSTFEFRSYIYDSAREMVEGALEVSVEDLASDFFGPTDSEIKKIYCQTRKPYTDLPNIELDGLKEAVLYYTDKLKEQGRDCNFLIPFYNTTELNDTKIYQMTRLCDELYVSFDIREKYLHQLISKTKDNLGIDLNNLYI